MNQNSKNSIVIIAAAAIVLVIAIVLFFTFLAQKKETDSKIEKVLQFLQDENQKTKKESENSLYGQPTFNRVLQVSFHTPSLNTYKSYIPGGYDNPDPNATSQELEDKDWQDSRKWLDPEKHMNFVNLNYRSAEEVMDGFARAIKQKYEQFGFTGLRRYQVYGQGTQSRKEQYWWVLTFKPNSDNKFEFDAAEFAKWYVEFWDAKELKRDKDKNLINNGLRIAKDIYMEKQIIENTYVLPKQDNISRKGEAK